MSIGRLPNGLLSPERVITTPPSEWQGPRIHPVSPAAHERLRELWQKQQATHKPEPKVEAKTQAKPPVPQEMKPMTDVILFTIEQVEQKFGKDVAAAVRENRVKRQGRRYHDIFVKPVCEMLYRKHLADSAPVPMPVEELAANNPLIEIGNPDTLKRYFRKHGVPTGPGSAPSHPANDPVVIKHRVETPALTAAAQPLAVEATEEAEPVTFAPPSPPINGLFPSVDDDCAGSFYVEAGQLAQQLEHVLTKLKENPVVKVVGSLRLELEIATP